MKWNEKRYYSLDYYLKETFHDKVYKLSLNGGMTCPNRDGAVSTGGCIFCSEGGSGDFAASSSLSVTEQIEAAKSLVANKVKSNKYIAYFQAYTNTYAPVTYLRALYTEAIQHPEIVALSIATRPDCLPPDVLDLLAELNQIKPVWIELGLQTCHEATAVLINRGYQLPVFEQAVIELNKRSIPVIVHVILGLPNETCEDMIQTIQYLNRQPVNGIKLQLMHVLKHTGLAKLYEDEPDSFHMMEFDTYIETVISCIEHLRSDIVIHRLTGDGPKNLLIAPLWSCDKRRVLNTLNQQLTLRDTYQGRKEKNNASGNSDAI